MSFLGESCIVILPGQIFDGQAGLHQNGFRDFDPATCRYNESDLLGLAGGVNTYSYVFNDPLRRMDLFGLESSPPEPP